MFGLARDCVKVCWVASFNTARIICFSRSQMMVFSPLISYSFCNHFEHFDIFIFYFYACGGSMFNIAAVLWWNLRMWTFSELGGDLHYNLTTKCPPPPPRIPYRRYLESFKTMSTVSLLNLGCSHRKFLSSVLILSWNVSVEEFILQHNSRAVNLPTRCFKNYFP